jgi:hypothetical protein
MPSLKTNFTVFDADAARGNLAILEALRDEVVRAFVFVPGANVSCAGERPERDLFPGAILFERRGDEERIALDRDDAGKEPFGAAPSDVREVDERRAAAERDRVDLVLGHQPAGLFDPGAALVRGDRTGLTAHRAERLDRGVLLARRVLLRGELRRRGQSGRRRC